MDSVQQINGRLYSPSYPTGLAVRLDYDGSVIKLLYEENSRDIPAQLALRSVGMDEKSIEMSWQVEGQAYAVQVSSGREVALLLDWLKSYSLDDVIDQLKTKKRKQKRIRTLVYSMLFLFLATPFLALWGAWNFSDALAEWVVNRIPIEQELQLAKISKSQLPFSEYEQHNKDWNLVMTLFNRLMPEESVYPYELFIAPDSSINAFAIPGGTIVVHQGLIDATRDSPDQLASVIAHEIQHIELKHGLKSLVKRAGFGILISSVLGDVSGTLGSISHQLLQLSFSREAESEADKNAVKQLIDADMDPYAMIEFFLVLEEKYGNSLEWFSTHPNHDTRIKDITRWINEYENSVL